MLKKLKVIFILLPYIAMILALVTLVKSLFYNFHNDTVPFFGILISSAISLFCIIICVGTGVCIVNYIKSSMFNQQLLWGGIVFLLNLIFSVVCLLIHYSQLKIIAIYFLITSFLLVISYIFCKKNSVMKCPPVNSQNSQNQV